MAPFSPYAIYVNSRPGLNVNCKVKFFIFHGKVYGGRSIRIIFINVRYLWFVVLVKKLVDF